MYIKEEIRDLAMSFQRARVLLTGFELGVFSAIGDGSLTSGEIAAALGTHHRATDRLLNALCALELLVKRNGQFSNTDEGRKYLVESSADYLSGLMHVVNLWDRWTFLTEAVRAGEPAAPIARAGRSGSWLQSFIGAMHDRGISQGRVLAYDLDLSDVRRMLDVGGGSGDFAMAFVQANPAMRATVFDLSDVIPLTAEYIARQGLTERIDTVAGDFHADPLPEGFDLVLLSAIVHMNDPDQNRKLVNKCAGALNPNGRLVILDHVMSEDRTRTPAGALFALNMIVGTRAGDTYTQSEMEKWIASAGLVFTERRETPFGSACVIAVKT